jgi:hypothetical protein
MEYAVSYSTNPMHVDMQMPTPMEVSMARDHKPGEEVNPNEVQETASVTTTPADGQATGDAAATAAPAENKSDERFIWVSAPDGNGGTTQVKRAEAIRALWQGTVTPYNPEGKKHSRGEIRKLISQWGGKEIPYQIVFAGTKGLAGGPPKSEAAPAAAPAEGQQG